MAQTGQLRLGLLDAIETTQTLRQPRTDGGASGDTDTDSGLPQDAAHTCRQAITHRLAGLLRALLRPRQRLRDTGGNLAGLGDDADIRSSELNGHRGKPPTQPPPGRPSCGARPTRHAPAASVPATPALTRPASPGRSPAEVASSAAPGAAPCRHPAANSHP